MTDKIKLTKKLIEELSENNIIPLDKIHAKSKLLWKCDNNHEWEAILGNRLYLNRGCPYCSGTLPSKENNLSLFLNKIKLKWDFNKNAQSPESLLPKSTTNAWWLCESGHSFMSSPHKIFNNKTKIGCPCCKGLKPSIDNNIMGFKQLIEEWDFNKNSCKPEDMTIGKGTKVWWKCSKGHEWESSIVSRVKGSGCPYCKNKSSLLEMRIFSEIYHYYNNTEWRNRKFKKEIDIFIPEYSIAIEVDGHYWHKTRHDHDLLKNNTLEKNGIKVIRVREYPLENTSTNDINFRYKDQHINILCNLFRKLFEITGDTNFKSYYENCTIVNNDFYIDTVKNSIKCRTSIIDIRPEIESEWDYNKNGFMTPENMSYGSGKKAWFKCKDNHEWETEIKNRSIGFNCPYCSGKKATETNNLAKIYPESIMAWCYGLNKNNPECYLPTSHEKVWWKNKNGEIKITPINDKVRYFKRENINE